MTAQMIETRINGSSLGIYRAKLLEYSVGAVSCTDGYVKPAGKPFPVLLTPKIGLRGMSITLDFEGDDARERSKAISSFTVCLMGKSDIELPDGFHYWCVFDSASSPKKVAPWIEQVTYKLHGLRHEGMITQHFSASGTIDVAGNMKTSPVVKLTPATGATSMGFNGITITGSSVVIIDGVNTTVHDASGNNVFGSTNMTEWPKLTPGKNTITLTNCTADVSYYPIYV